MQAIERSLETKRMFVRYISHEMRSPLSTMTMGLKLLKDELGKLNDVIISPGIFDIILDIETAGSVAINTINEVLLQDKVETGILTLDVEPVKVDQLLIEVVHPFHIQARQSGINLCVSGLQDPTVGNTTLCVDRSKISTVIRNLLSNALKFTPRGGNVTIEICTTGTTMPPHSSSSRNPNNKLKDYWPPYHRHRQQQQQQQQQPSHHQQYQQQEQEQKDQIEGRGRGRGGGGWLEISVTDTGPGISKENQCKLFDNIIQFSPGKLQNGGGSGLGLYISKGIMDKHHGTISVCDGEDGRGSSFKIMLPLIMNAQTTTTGTTRHSAAAWRLTPSSFQQTVVNDAGSVRLGRRLDAAINDPEIPAATSKQSLFAWTANSFRISPSNSNSSFRLRQGPTPPFDHVESFRQSNSRVSTIREISTRRRNHDLSDFDMDGEGGDFDIPDAGPIPNFSIQGSVSTKCPGLLYYNALDSSAHGTSKLKVLVVDDVHLNRKMLCRLLRERSKVIVEAVDGQHAVTEVERSFKEGRPFNLITMDYQMPLVDGPTAAKTIRSLGFQGVIIGITGNGLQVDVDVFMASGVDRVLIKPLDAKQLEEALASLINPLTGLKNQNSEQASTGFEHKSADTT